MKKIFILIFAICFTLVEAKAQFKNTDGDTILKGQSNVCVEFTFPDLEVNRKPEQEFIDKKQKKNEEAAELWEGH